jgi:hypothetical protein
LIHGQIFETEFKKWMLKEAGKATSRKRKAVPEVEVVAVHEFDSDSDSDEDINSGGRRTGATSTVSNLSDSGAGIKPV